MGCLLCAVFRYQSCDSLIKWFAMLWNRFNNMENFHVKPSGPGAFLKVVLWQYLSCVTCLYQAFFWSHFCFLENHSLHRNIQMFWYRVEHCDCLKLVFFQVYLFSSLVYHFVSNCAYSWSCFFQHCAIELSFSLHFFSFEVSSLSGFLCIF